MMTELTARRRAAACAVAAVAAVIAGGCAAHGARTLRPANGEANAPAQAAAGHPGHPGHAPAQAAGEAGAVAAPVRVPLSVPNSVTARRGVVLTDCAATSVGGHAAGTVTDPGRSAATYTITVFFTTSKATVIGYATTKVHAAPGKAAEWQANGHFSAPQGMRCVLRGVSTR